ncbi:MAG TPA: ABC transporter ATP-binding protein [Tepidisphaeraceae bacterium]|jgi:ABC-2 type transport system ATP-binding protein|nr:ABC transporter ATP-binding protein [Tepidisphaeraceae bacterium]
MAAALRVDNLQKSYGRNKAVNGISLEIARKEIFALLGPNGAGKTTTIECIIGLRSADLGTVEVAGLDAKKNPRQVKDQLGVQLQETALHDKITPLEALRLFASFYSSPGDPWKLLKQFSLEDTAHAKYDTLSSGQKQRLAVALAMVNRPMILLLDEPTAGLDPQSRRELQKIIRDLRDEGRSVLITTHYIEEAELLCDRVGIIDRGQMIALGTPEELVAKARTPPSIIAKTSRPPSLEKLKQFTGVQRADLGYGGCTVHTSNISQTIIELVGYLQAERIELWDINIHRPSLEDLFLELTGREIRN